MPNAQRPRSPSVRLVGGKGRVKQSAEGSVGNMGTETLSRRELLVGVSVGAAVLGGAAGCNRGEERTEASSRRPPSEEDREWSSVRRQFRLDRDYIHLAGLLLASHPDPVREAIERHRRELDENPALYLTGNSRELESEVREAAAEYMGTRAQDLALTDSTTMGTALVYNGVEITEGQEFLTARFDYYSTHQAIRYKARRTGATVREIPLYQDVRTVTAEEIVENLMREVRPETRVITATWVHSSTGLKMPIRQIADRLPEINAGRGSASRVLLAVDGVHGLGVEATPIPELRCDFFMAGTHKWLFGPRGTGILWGNPETQAHVTPTIPTFSRLEGWGSWMTPGGFKPYEHQWALVEAFRYHQRLGKERVQERIHALARHLKEGLAGMQHVTLYTPMDDALSAGIVCFMVDGLSPEQVVSRLQDRGIVASTTPYSPSYARLTPGVYNTTAELDRALSAIRDLA